MTLTLILLIVAVLAVGLISRKAGECGGPDVGKRFLEVTPDYSVDGLRRWIEAYPSQSRRYAFPVLFPLDLLFLVALACLLAVASMATARSLHWGQGWIWTLAIFPVLYAVCDFVENVLLARFMVSATTATSNSVALAQTFTGLKLATVAISALQLLVLLVWGAVRILVHALR